LAAKTAQKPRTADRLGWEVWLVAALAIAVYSPTLAAPFHFDDFSLLTDPAVVLPDGPLTLLQPERTRPLAYLTFWLNYQIGGADPFGYHLLNIALLAALAFAQDTAPYAGVTTHGALAIVYIVLISTVLGYWAWFRVLQLIPSDIAALGILPSPMIGVVSSTLILGEPLGWPEVAAVALLTAALTTMLYRRKR